jgi:phage FluMu gp28-like protein
MKRNSKNEKAAEVESAKSVADSNAPAAKVLKGDTHEKLTKGSSARNASGATSPKKISGGGRALKSGSPGRVKAIAALPGVSSQKVSPSRTGQETKREGLTSASAHGPLGTSVPTLASPSLASVAAGQARTVESPRQAMLKFREYQEKAFWSENRIEVWLWSRQIGKSYTLAAWAVYRLIQFPGRLVTILSNSKDNGIEVNQKVADICLLLGQAFEQADMSEDADFLNMRLETRISIGGKTGRIKVLAASPRTARGFSGDLILDEFAFHENSRAIWEAAEPIISSNKDFWCRIASTPNGKYNMFYQLCSGGVIPVRKVPRSIASTQGARIFSLVNGREITPAEARAEASDKAAYDQNYECQFADENMALLTYELIARAEDPLVGVLCEGEWSAAAIGLMHRAVGDLEVGVDVGRQRDLTVITVIERVERLRKVRAQLALEQMRLPDQQERLEVVLKMAKFRRCRIDMTGLGLGLFEYTERKFGSRVRGINFSSRVPATRRLQAEGRKAENVRVTEAMATELVGVFEDGGIRIPADAKLREDLRKPERVVTPGGNVSIAATRTEAGHADRFWSVALAVEAGAGGSGVLVTNVGSYPDGAQRGGLTADFAEDADFQEGRVLRGQGVLV